MIRLSNLLTLLSLFLLVSSCRETAALRPAGGSDGPVDAAKQPVFSASQIENIFTKEDSLAYQGYTVVKLHKNVIVGAINTDVSYAVLRKGKEEITKFDGLYHPAGNATDFGLFPLLGGQRKQLVVEQSIPRNWSHWIVKLEPDSRLIFESRKWGVDGELTPIDVNQDGVFELTKKLTTFYDFDRIPTAHSPLIDILFIYDAGKQEYIPANQTLRDYALHGIENEIGKLRPNDESTYLSEVVRILLRYIYAGQGEGGWSFYEKEYKRPDKESVRAAVLERLKNEPVYKFIYNQ